MRLILLLLSLTIIAIPLVSTSVVRCGTGDEQQCSSDPHPELTSFLSTLPSDVRDAIVGRFQTYLQIDTRHPEPDYEAAVSYLESYVADHLPKASSFRLSIVASKPMLVVEWLSKNPTLKSVLLSSHMDTVGTKESAEWVSDPLDARIDSDGNIVARGSQDMKCVGMAYLEAFKLLMSEDWSPSRDIRVLFTVDEETGSSDGMESLVELPSFREWNIGFGLDEGIALPQSDEFDIYYAERVYTWVKFIAEGPGGHGSQFVDSPATHKLLRLGNELLTFRDEQAREMGLRGAAVGDVMTVNIDAFQSGDESAPNVVPKKASMVVDIRYPPHVTWEKINGLLNDWSQKYDVQYELIDYHETNPMSDLTDPLFSLFHAAVQRLGFKTRIRTFQASTDARFGRLAGANMFGFTPIDETEQRLHDVNEDLNVEKFLQAVYVYMEIVKALTKE